MPAVNSREICLLSAGVALGYVACKLLSSRAPGNTGALDLRDCTLQYFPIPALGEPIRLMLTLSKVPFTDKRVPGVKFREMKSTLPFGQMPVLTLKSGEMLTQCRAIARLVGRITVVDGYTLYPEDGAEAYRSDELIDAVMDIQSNMGKTFGIKDEQEKLAARAQLFKEGGLCKQMTDRLEAMLSKKASRYALADHLTAADIFIFTVLNSLRCGFLDAVDTNYLDAFPTLKVLCSAVAAHPAVKAYYQDKSDLYNCYKH